MTNHETERVVKARFWAKADVRGANDCWPWKGRGNGQGYGVFANAGKAWRAHRLAVILDGREIPDGLVVDHTCRNRGCVNPAHLRVVTPRVNTLENSEHFTAAFYARSHCSKGHEYTPSDSFVRTRGARRIRVCRICQRQYEAAYKKRKALTELGGNDG